MIYTPYDFQYEGVTNIKVAMRKHKHVLFVMPTASGKTTVFCYIAEQVAARGKRVLILVHRRELFHQCSNHLWEMGVQHGLIAAGKSRSILPVQIASVDTLRRRLDMTKEPDLIISDEAHHDVCNTRKMIYRQFPNSYLIGVTATPERLDGKGLGVKYGGFYDVLVLGPYIDELIDKYKKIPPFKYFAPPCGFDSSLLHKRAGDVAIEEAELMVDKRVLIGNTIQHYVKHTNGVPFIAFGVTVKHARNIADMFNGAGILTESIDGTMATGQRDRIIKNHTEGRTIGLTSCDLISEGTDIPRVGCSILMRPTLSLSLFLQACGRACRLYPGKEFTYIHDHANLIDTFGPPWARRAWTLEGKSEKKRKEADEVEQVFKVVRCTKCYAVFPVRLLKCPECGALRDIKDTRKIKTVDGELQLVNPDSSEVQKIIHEWDKDYGRKQMIWNAKTIEEMKMVAKVLGHNERWAYAVMSGREKKRRERDEQIKQVRMAL